MFNKIILNIKKNAYLYMLVLFIITFGVYERYDLSRRFYSECGPWSNCASPEMNINNITSDWKTYRNEEYGFEFKYPKDWKIENENQRSCEPEGCTETNLLTINGGSSWFHVIKTDDGACWQVHDWNKFQEFNAKVTCINGISLSLEYFNDIKDEKEIRSKLEDIMNTFKFTK